jgi:WD40 repeat protein
LREEKMATAVPRVLIIDDDEVVRQSLAKHLRSEGVLVDVAASPEQALELLKHHQYQVVTTDIYHDNSSISGDEFILQNIEQLKKSAVMILTAFRSTDIERLAELNKLNIPVFEKENSDSQLRFVEIIKQKLSEPKIDDEALTVSADPELESKPDDSSPNVPAGFELIHTIDEDTGWIGQLSWSPDGKKLAAQTSQKGVLVWTRENNKAEIIDSNAKPTGGLAWSPDGYTLAYTSRLNVSLYGTEKMVGEGFVDEKDSDDQLSPGLAWSPDGKSLAVGNRGGKINIFSPENHELIKSLQSTKDWTFALAWSPDSNQLAAGGDDKVLKLWSFPSVSFQELTLHSDQITCVSSCPTEDLLASGSADKSIRIWTRSTGEHVTKLEGHSKRITSVAFSHDGSLLASKSDDGTVKLWRTDMWISVATLEEPATHPGGLYTPGIAFHPKELILATLASENAKIRIWKLRASQLLTPDEESILAASVSDQPASTDSLGFEPYVKALTRFLTDERTQPPLTLSIEGEWGSGKSSFMLQLENALKRAYQQQKIRKLLKLRWNIRMRKERIPTPLRHRWIWRSVWPIMALPREERHPTFASVRFNAWRHDKDSSLWASFALALLHKLSGELPGPLRAWTHLKLSARRFRWIDGWPVLLRTMLISASLLALSVTLFYLLYSGGVEKILGDAKEFKGGEILLTVIKGSGVVGSVVAFFYLLNTVKETIGDPFKSDLKKYLQTPSYDAQISFIEQFHDDFGKIIETFAGKNKVYVFIDDLDRSEVPKAADLMQAINLLISDSPRVFFIVGMDRDKVAAGLAVKYEKILPYLSAVSQDRKDAINADRLTTQKSGDLDALNGLEFGYSFIEKFIQIPFRIPQPAELGLAKLLDSISPMLGDATVPLATTSLTTSEATVNPPSSPLPRQPTQTASPGSATAAPQQVSAPAVTTEQEERRELIRIAVTNDSMTVRKIVQMVAPALDYNPRRIKQFINMFRLKALIATETGLFDAPRNTGSHKGLTLPQLGKFVAIGLKWPRLLIDLDEDNSLLRELDKWARGHPFVIEPAFNGWTHRSDLAELIKYGCTESKDPFDPAKLADPSRYSLASVDAQRLLRVTPPVRSTHASSPGISL